MRGTVPAAVSFSVPEFARGYLTSSENPVCRSITYHTSLYRFSKLGSTPQQEKCHIPNGVSCPSEEHSFDSQLIDLKNPLEVIYLALTTGQGFQ